MDKKVNIDLHHSAQNSQHRFTTLHKTVNTDLQHCTKQSTQICHSGLNSQHRFTTLYKTVNTDLQHCTKQSTQIYHTAQNSQHRCAILDKTSSTEVSTFSKPMGNLFENPIHQSSSFIGKFNDYKFIRGTYYNTEMVLDSCALVLLSITRILRDKIGEKYNSMDQ